MNEEALIAMMAATLVAGDLGGGERYRYFEDGVLKSGLAARDAAEILTATSETIKQREKENAKTKTNP